MKNDQYSVCFPTISSRPVRIAAPYDGPEEGAHATDGRHENGISRRRPVEHVRMDAPVETGVKPAGNGREEGRHDVGGKLVLVHVQAEESNSLGFCRMPSARRQKGSGVIRQIM